MYNKKNLESEAKAGKGLNLKDLPWNSDRLGQVTESIHIITRKDDPECTWYRPRWAILRDSNLWSLKRYLHDQNTISQYTHDDMMIKLGYPYASWSQLFTNNMSQDITSLREPNLLRQKKLIPCPKMLSPIPLNQTAEEVLWPNLHICSAYKSIKYVADELSHEDISPYIMLMRSGDCFDNTNSSIGSVYRKLQEMRDLDRQREITRREKEIMEKAVREIAEIQAERKRNSEWNDDTEDMTESTSYLSIPESTTKRNKFIRAITAPFRWLKKRL